MHRNNRPPTLHREDRTHTATDTQRHSSLRPGPCGGTRLWAGPAAGEASFSDGVFPAASQGRHWTLLVMKHPPSLSGARLDKWEWGQHLLPNPMVKRASQLPPEDQSSSDHQEEAGVPFSSGCLSLLALPLEIPGAARAPSVSGPALNKGCQLRQTLGTALSGGKV